MGQRNGQKVLQLSWQLLQVAHVVVILSPWLVCHQVSFLHG